MAFSHDDGPRTYRYFTGKNVAFLQVAAIVRLCQHKHHTRTLAIHHEGGFHNLHGPEDAGKIQLLDLLFERDELEEFVVQNQPLPEAKPGLEIPECST